MLDFLDSVHLHRSYDYLYLTVCRWLVYANNDDRLAYWQNQHESIRTERKTSIESKRLLLTVNVST